MSERRDPEFDFNAVSQLVFEQGGGPIVFLHDDGTVRCANAAMEELSGYDREELVGQRVDSFLPSWQELEADHFHPGSTTRIESKLVKSTGRTVSVELRIGAAKENAEHPQFLAIRDVREKNRGDRKSTAKDRRHEQFFSALGDPALIWDRGRAIVDANAAAEELTGVRREALLKRQIDALWPETPDWSDLLEYFSEHGSVYDVTVSLTGRNGDPIECVASGSVLRNRVGRPQFYSVVLRDVTLQRRLERQLFQRQRTEVAGNLAEGIANDLNNIISVQLGYAQRILMKNQPNWEYRHDLEKVLEASERARDVIRQIGQIHRPNDQKKVMIDLYVVLRGVLDVIRRCLPRDVEVRDTLDPRAGKILGVPGEIRRAMIELCMNAGYAMKSGGGVVSVSLESSAEAMHVDAAGRLRRDREHVTVSIGAHSDALDGATPQKIFDPKSASQDRAKGGKSRSALGIVRCQEGAVVVGRDQKNVARCHVSFPKVTEEEVYADLVQVPASRDGERILIVDDETLVAELYRRALTDLGYVVDKANSVEQALIRVGTEQTEYAAIVCDFAMPGFTGFDLAKSLEELGQKTPILLITGNEDLVPKKKLPNLVLQMMTKPVNLDEFARCLRDMLDRHQVATAGYGPRSNN